MSEPAATWELVSSLTPWDKNPRRNDKAAVEVAKSIERFGFGAPLLVRTADRVVIAGHTRLKAAIRLGMDKVPVRFLDLDPAQAAALALADNKLGELAEWDDAKLAEVIADLQAEGVPVDDLGWSSDELAAMVGDVGEVEEGGDEEIPVVDDGPADSVPAMVYELGPHRLICGDCRDPEVVAKLLGGRSINLAFTSPPYASQRKYDESSGFKPIPPDEYVGWFEAVQANVRAHLAADGSWFVNIKEHSEDGQRSLYVKDLLLAHARQWEWRFVDELCWLRQSLPGDPRSMGRFKNGFEPVFHFAASPGFRFRPEQVRHASVRAFKYEDQKAAGLDISAASQGKGSNAQGPVGQGAGLAYPSNVLDIKQGANVVGHSAAFPVDFPGFFIRAFTDAGDAVYDPFMGSGTTLIASAKNNRTAFGCEISPSYCDLIRRRWTRWAREHGQDPGSGALEAKADP